MIGRRFAWAIRFHAIFACINIFVLHSVVNAQPNCECNIQYLVDKKPVFNSDEFNLNMPANDVRDICDFRCVDKCNEEIKEHLGGDKMVINQEAMDKMCNDVVPDRSLNRDGITLMNIWNMKGCNGLFGEHKITNNVCCRDCRCKLVKYNNHKTRSVDYENYEIIADLSSEIFAKHDNQRGFLCTDVDHERECEQDCRNAVTELLDNYDVTDSSEDNFEPLIDRQESDKICNYLEKPVHFPGVDLAIRIETGPKEEKMHKDISLGNICCKRQCECEIIYRFFNKTQNAEMHRVDLRKIESLEQFFERPSESYYCQDEIDECLQDCKMAAGDYLRSDKLKDKDSSVLDVKPLSEFKSSRRACLVYGRDSPPTGINLYLRYSVGNEDFKKRYPFTQALDLGFVCCKTDFGYPLFPRFMCSEWGYNEYPDEIDD